MIPKVFEPLKFYCLSSPQYRRRIKFFTIMHTLTIVAAESRSSEANILRGLAARIALASSTRVPGKTYRKNYKYSQTCLKGSPKGGAKKTCHRDRIAHLPIIKNLNIKTFNILLRPTPVPKPTPTPGVVQ